MTGIGDNGGPPLDEEDNPFGPAGWVKIGRDIRSHPIVGFGLSGSYSRAEAFLDLIMECRYVPGEVWNKGKKMTLERGQLLGAISWLAHRWNWTPKTVRWFLDQLENEGMVARSSAEKAAQIDENGQSDAPPNRGKPNGKHNGNQIGVLSISNYNVYQHVVQMQRQAEWQAKGQPNGNPTASQGQDLKKERKEEGKKEEEVYYAADASPTETPTAIAPAIASAPIQLPTKLPRAKRETSIKTSLPSDWLLPKPWGEWALAHFVVSPTAVRAEAAKFRDHWISVGGKKIDWEATWRNWCRSDIGKSWKPRDGVNGSIVDGELMAVAEAPVDDGWGEVRELNRLARESDQ